MPGLSQWQAAVDDLANGDLIGITDVSDSTQSANGSSKKVEFSQLLSSIHKRLQNVSGTSGALTLDCRTYHTFVMTLTGATGFTFSNLDVGQTIALVITNGGTYITWPATVKWPDGPGAPELTSGTDRVVLQKLSATVIHASLAGQAYA
jgi:hypothetical protein